jgi:membrane protein YqaA with SNARE-associated domain
MSAIDDETEGEKRVRLVDRIVPLLTLILVLAIMAGVLYFYHNYSEEVARLQGLGYLGAFLISLIFNATVIFPAGNVLVLAALGATLPSAVVVGLAGGTGATIGELTGYIAGYSGQAVVQRRGAYIRIERWVKRWGALTIFILSAVPFLFDLAGIAAGVVRFPVWKFLIACWLGRTILYVVVALAGALGWEAVLGYFG